MTHETQHALARGYAAGIFGGHVAPCLSIYLPTHRHHPENKQDPIRFGDLVKSLEQLLVQNRWSFDARALLEPLRAMASDAAFWSHTADGVAAFVAEGFFRVYTLPRTVHELAVVGVGLGGLCLAIHCGDSCEASSRASRGCQVCGGESGGVRCRRDAGGGGL